MGFRAGGGRRPGGGARRGGRGARYHPTAGHERERVGGRRAGGPVRLLVFDNCEHVLDAAADSARRHPRALDDGEVPGDQPGGPRLDDEQLWPVPSLDVESRPSSLFVERAQRRTGRSRPSEADAVEEICRRLDGIPLAIELAASRMASMTAAEVRDRLDRPLQTARRLTARPGTPSDVAPRRAMVLRPARRRRKGAAGSLFGVRRWFRPRKCLRGGRSDDATSSQCWICSTHWCASRCSSPIGRPGGPGMRCWRRSASSPRSNSSPAVKQTRPAPRTPATSRGGKPTSGAMGQPAPARGLHLVRRRAR